MAKGKTFLIVFSLLVAVSAQVQVHIPGVELRLNYGVIFKKVFTISNAESQWSHTFILPKLELPKSMKELDVKACDPTKLMMDSTLNDGEAEEDDPIKKHGENILRIMCEKINGILEDYKLQRNLTISDISQVLTQVSELLPPEVNMDRRKTRAPLEIIGDASSFLFGTATNKRVNLLEQQIMQVSEGLRVRDMTLTSWEKELVSVLNMTNNRIDSVQNGQSENQKLISTLVDDLNNWQKELLDTNKRYDTLLTHVTQLPFVIGRLTQIITADLQQLSLLKTRSQNYLYGIQTLSEGYLPLSLISPTDILNVLKGVQAKLTRLHPGYQIQHRDVYHYYHTRSVISLHATEKIYIQLQIPVSDSPTSLDVFQTEVLRLPDSASDQKGATEIQNVARFIAVNKAKTHFRELHLDDLVDCNGEYVKTCRNVITMTPRKRKTCTSSMFFNERHDIKNLCETTFIVNHKEGAAARDLGSGFVLLTGMDERWTVTCPRKGPERNEGCGTCVYRLPCGCSLHGPDFYLRSSLHACNDTVDTSKILYPVNLQVLDRFFNHSKYADFSANGLGIEPLELNLPEFEVKAHGHSAQKSEDVYMKLDELAEQIERNQEAVYATPTDHLYDMMRRMPSSLATEASVPMITASIVMSSLSLIFSLVLYCKFRKLRTVVQFLNQGKIENIVDKMIAKV